MRTTITLDEDTANLVKAAMQRRGAGLKQVVNEALRDALAGPPPRRPYRTSVFTLGQPMVPLDRALALAGELEDEELQHRAARR